MNGLDLRTFADHAGDAFVVSKDDGDSLTLILDSATAAREQRPDGRPFSVIFRGSSDTRLPQATYRLEHSGIEAFDIFLVPVGLTPDGTEILYEAVFN